MCDRGRECTPEHAELVNHIMRCDSCYAPNSNYCGIGRALKMENDARFICDLADLADRRRWMITLRREYGDRAALIEQAVKDKFAELKAVG